MSTKVNINSLFRRAYTVAAESVKGHQAAAASAMKRAAAVESSPATGGVVEKAPGNKEVFWMKDPKNGNWVPETHFDDVDAADLRESLLPNKFKKAF